MTEFRIAWGIDIDAETPAEAVRKAREIQLDPDSAATVFEVCPLDDKGRPKHMEKTVVDLMGILRCQ